MCAAVSVSLALVGCSSDSETPETSPVTETADEAVTIKVSIDAGLEPEARENFDARVKAFQTAHENITVEAQEYTWTATTFTADLAGGTLPHVFTIPFTDGRGLIAAKQIADISDLVAELPYAADSGRFQSPPMDRRCTTTGPSSPRPALIQTRLPKPGMRSAKQHGRSAKPPARPVMRR
jgi:ABC-type glycerol-3-phosphate transport system substrate-binding protein